MFTKALDHDSTVRHTEAMGCEFMFGREPVVFIDNKLSAKASLKKLALEVESRFKTSGRMDAWTRMDCTANLTRPQSKEDRHGETLHTKCVQVHVQVLVQVCVPGLVVFVGARVLLWHPWGYGGS